MKFRKPSRRQMLELCAEVRDDDGVDPKTFFKKGRGERKIDRKTLQLCAQVADALNGTFAACRDERLQMLQVASVKPAPDASRLLATICSVVTDAAFEADEIQLALNAAAGRLRSEIAAAITRKRAPQIVFHVAGAAPRKEGT